MKPIIDDHTYVLLQPLLNGDDNVKNAAEDFMKILDTIREHHGKFGEDLFQNTHYVSMLFQFYAMGMANIMNPGSAYNTKYKAQEK